MSIIQLPVLKVGQSGMIGANKSMAVTDNLATITTAGYLNNFNLGGNPISPGDVLEVIYDYNVQSGAGTPGLFTPVIVNGVITLQQYVSKLVWYGVTLSAAALASAGKIVIQASTGLQQYFVRDIRVNYSASGLSGGGGDRLVVITDGTTIWNNAGITAALLGTPVNTLWGGSGNPLPGTVAMNTLSQAGANIYAQYSGGTSDFSTGSVSISVLIERSI